MSDTKTIRVEYDLPHSLAKVWRILTEPKLLESWLMPNDIAPAVGHRFNFRSQPVGEWDGIVYCEILTVEPARRLVYSWKAGSDANKGWGHSLDTMVTWTLTEKPGGTLLLLEHSGFREQDRFAYEQMGKGWNSFGAIRLKTALEQI